MRQATRTQWIKCTIAILLYLAFLIWVRSWWGLIVVPFIFDIYITKKIPWSFWKKSKNPTVRNVMSWVDAIVFALVAVYFVNIYIFQNVSDSFLVFGKVIAGRRLPVRQQDELRATRAEYAAFHAVGATYVAYFKYQIVYRMASVEI